MGSPTTASDPSEPAEPARPSAPRPWLLPLILLVAFGLRVAYVLQIQASPFFDAPVMDPAYHVDWARAFASGERFQDGPFFRAPLYPWFLGLCLKLFGDGLLAPRLVQCLLGTLTTGLVYLLGRDAFDRRTGLLASAGAATYWVLIYFDGELLIPTLAVPLNLLALWLTLRLGRDASPARSLAAGVAWGLAAIARPNVLLLMPFLFFWLLARLWRERRSAWLAGGALTLGTLLPILPLTAYNSAQGDTALIATQAGVNLWIGNNPDHFAREDVSSAIVPGTRPGWWEGFHDAVAQANAAEGRELRPSEVSSYYSGLAWSWIFEQPGDALSHALRKLRLFWSAEELGNNQPVRGFAHRFGPLTRFLPLGFALVAPLGLLGLALVLLCGERRSERLPLALFLIVYTLTVVAFFVNGRFRLPVIPVLLVLGAHATLWTWGRVRAAEWARLAPAGLLVAAAAAVALTTPTAYRQDEATMAYQLGVAAVQEEDSEAALEHFAAALALRPTFAQAHVQRARILRDLKRPNEAEAELRRALELQPGDREALSDAADLLLTAPNRVPEALELARTLTRAHPSFSQGHYHLGRALGQSGDAAGAAAAFRAGLDADPDDVPLQLALGNALGMQRQFPEAAEVFRGAYASAVEAGWATPEFEREDPERAQAYWRIALQLFQVLHFADRAPDARAFLQELEQRHPGDPRVQNVRANAPR